MSQSKISLHRAIFSFITRSYSFAFSDDLVVSCKNLITTLIQSRSSRSHLHGVDQSNKITQVVCARSLGVNVSCSNGVNEAEGLGNNENVNLARISTINSSRFKGEVYHHFPHHVYRDKYIPKPKSPPSKAHYFVSVYVYFEFLFLLLFGEQPMQVL